MIPKAINSKVENFFIFVNKSPNDKIKTLQVVFETIYVKMNCVVLKSQQCFNFPNLSNYAIPCWAPSTLRWVAFPAPSIDHDERKTTPDGGGTFYSRMYRKTMNQSLMSIIITRVRGKKKLSPKLEKCNIYHYFGWFEIRKLEITWNISTALLFLFQVFLPIFPYRIQDHPPGKNANFKSIPLGFPQRWWRQGVEKNDSLLH